MEYALIACVENNGEVQTVFDGNFDFMSLYGKIWNGRSEALHDFDLNQNRDSVLQEANAISSYLGLELKVLYPYK